MTIEEKSVNAVRAGLVWDAPNGSRGSGREREGGGREAEERLRLEGAKAGGGSALCPSCHSPLLLPPPWRGVPLCHWPLNLVAEQSHWGLLYMQISTPHSCV